MTSLYLTGGGFPAFWYHLGYVQRLRELHGPTSWPCSGVSAGSLAAWVLAHEHVSWESVTQIALELHQNMRYVRSLDTWVLRFMTEVSKKCGSFRPSLYMGAYAINLTNRTPVLLQSLDPVLQIRASCFIPILSGGLVGPGGWLDGCFGSSPTLPPEVIRVSLPVLPHHGYLGRIQNILPLERHRQQYDIGRRNAFKLYHCSSRL
jgi:hypothetical protein